MNPRERARHRGLSLPELILALAGMGLVALGVGSIVNAAAYGTSSARDLRGVVVKEKTLTSRLGGAIRSSRRVLQQGADYLVLWKFDTNSSDAPDLSEVQMIDRTVTGDLVSYAAPLDLLPGADVAYELTTDFRTTLNAIKGTSDFPSSRWGTGVTAMALTLDAATAQEASLVSYRLTLAAGTQQTIAVGAAAPRNQP